MQDADARVRREAVGALGYLKDETTVPAVVEAASDPDHAVRRAAISALAFAAGPAVATPILAGLSDTHWQVREAAAVVAGRVLPGHASAETAIDGLIEVAVGRVLAGTRQGGIDARQAQGGGGDLGARRSLSFR